MKYEGAVKIKNALISVYDKEGIVSLASSMDKIGINLLSSGGTAKKLKESGIGVMDVSEYTGYPMLFGHRVVTLHPKVHGGILYRRDMEQDRKEAREHGILDIGLVIANLYPVQEAIARNAPLEEVIELTDIGGPALVRAAAKNHKHVGVVVDIKDYESLARELSESGGLGHETRLRLAQKAFQTTSEYDNLISEFYKKHIEAKNA
jgi:phosphoribosylaminoimidazolecarboxamide formyltransferase/IMP cyclohydrolase